MLSSNLFNIIILSGLAWAAATTEGILIYSLDSDLMFDPYQLDLDITPESIKETIKKHNYAKGNILFFIDYKNILILTQSNSLVFHIALIMSLKLNESNIVREVFECVPPEGSK